MKRSQEIIGLPVLDVSRGELLEKVASLVIEPEAGKVAYLLLERTSHFTEMRLLDFRDVLGIGDYAVATEKEENITPVSLADRALQLLEKDVRVLNAKVLSHKGSLLGTVREMIIDENTGQIVACEVSPVNGEEPFQVARDSILTFGKSHLVVRQPGSPEQPTLSPEPVPGSSTQQASPPGQNGNGDQDIIELFQEQQVKYLLGRRSGATIKDRDGNIIVEKGQAIDEKVIKKAQETDTYYELSMYAE